MTEERITEHRDEAGNTHTTHTVVTDVEPRRGASFTMILLLIVALVAIGAFVIFGQVGNSEIAENMAVEDAANQVNDAAQSVGDAADNAGEAIDNATGN